MTCFAPGFGGQGGPESVMDDWEVYREKAMGQEENCFGLPMLWVTLWRKPNV